MKNTHTEKTHNSNKGKFKPCKGSPHMLGIVRSETAQRELERAERELLNCSMVRRACDLFFKKRGICLEHEAPPKWDENLIESCF